MKNFKRMLTGTAIATSLVTSAIAGDCGFSGFYMGAQLGAGTTNTELKFDQSDKAATATLAAQGKVNIKSSLAGTDPIGGLHVGYGKQFSNRLYVGIEAYGNLSRNSSKYSYGTALGEISAKSERTNSFGIALRPGVVFGNALFYVKAGIESANFKYSISEHIGKPINSNSSGSKNSRSLGFVPGIGVAFNATDHIILGVEATHTFYKNATIENVGRREGLGFDARGGANPAGTNTNSTKFESQATDVFARVSYKW